MPDSLQPGPHLSPDQLSAFAENALPEHERVAALAHLADCADCRQVVFLTQQASPVLAAAPAVETPRRSWFSLPQIFIASGAALACSLILALVMHFRPDQTTSPVTTAKVEAPQPIAPPATPPPTPAPTPQKPAAPQTQSARLSTAATHAQEAPPPSAAPLSPVIPKVVPPPPAPQIAALGRSYHGSDIGSDHPEPTRSAESKMNSTSNFAASANSTTAYAAPKAPAVVAGANAQPGPVAALAPAPVKLGVSKDAIEPNITRNGAEIDALPSSGRSITMLAAAPPPPAPPLAHLPSNKPVVSQLFAAGRTLALDTAGALFLSYDAGQHWTAVATQWSGKAVRLSFAPSPARLYQVMPQQSQPQLDSSVTTGAAASGATQQSQQTVTPTAGFQLTTASGAVWLSTDGITWHAR